MTPKMQTFVAGVVSGLKPSAAGLAAGYSRATVDQAVSRLMKHPEVKKAIASARRAQSASKNAAVPAKKKRAAANTLAAAQERIYEQLGGANEENGLLDEYESPMHFMEHAMNNKKLTMGVRFEAAKQLMPYKHPRLGEKGKKESKKDDAERVAGAGKFSAKAPPGRTHLRSVN